MKPPRSGSRPPNHGPVVRWTAARRRPRSASVPGRRDPGSIHSSTSPCGSSRTTSGTPIAPVARRARRPAASRSNMPGSGSASVLANSGPSGVSSRYAVAMSPPLTGVDRGDAEAGDERRRQRAHGAPTERRRAAGGTPCRGGRTSRRRRPAAGPTGRAPRRPRRRRAASAPSRRAASSGASRRRSRRLARSIATITSKRSKSAAVNWRARCSTAMPRRRASARVCSCGVSPRW